VYARYYSIVWLLLLLIGGPTQAQETCCTIQGIVLDATTGTALPGASIFIPGTTKGTTTDSLGRYTLPVDPGMYSVVFSFIGFHRFLTCF
jgi:hypothetical protein